MRRIATSADEAERLCSLLILDGKLEGWLDQVAGVLHVEEGSSGAATEAGKTWPAPPPCTTGCAAWAPMSAMVLTLWVAETIFIVWSKMSWAPLLL